MWSKCYHVDAYCYHVVRNVIIWDQILSSGAYVIMWNQMFASGTKCYHVEADVVTWSILFCKDVVVC
jgi:hypothetical protein